MGSISIRLIHYSNKLIELNHISYLQKEHFKPNGLWFSVEGIEGDLNWRDWCLGEERYLEYLAYRHEIILKNKYTDILHLYDVADILYFTKEYGYNKGHYIDWKKLTKFYKGIIIAPYSYEIRFDVRTFWYYGWDCASGCIWSLDAIQEFRLLPQVGSQNT